MNKIKVYNMYGKSQEIEVSDDGKMWFVGMKVFKSFKKAYNHALVLMDKN